MSKKMDDFQAQQSLVLNKVQYLEYAIAHPMPSTQLPSMEHPSYTLPQFQFTTIGQKRGFLMATPTESSSQCATAEQTQEFQMTTPTEGSPQSTTAEGFQMSTPTEGSPQSTTAEQKEGFQMTTPTD